MAIAPIESLPVYININSTEAALQELFLKLEKSASARKA
jgi:hypothetical protein